MRMKNIPTCLICKQSVLLMKEYTRNLNHYKIIGQFSPLSSRPQQAFKFVMPGLYNTYGYAMKRRYRGS